MGAHAVVAQGRAVALVEVLHRVDRQAQSLPDRIAAAERSGNAHEVERLHQVEESLQTTRLLYREELNALINQRTLPL